MSPLEPHLLPLSQQARPTGELAPGKVVDVQTDESDVESVLLDVTLPDVELLHLV